MATIQHTNTATDGAIVYTWTGMANNDVGTAIFLDSKHHLTVQVYGTFGTATVEFDGSIDGTNFVASTKKNAGGAVTFTAAGMAAFDTEPLYVRPKATGGGVSTSVTCILLVRGDD
jgi:hypothetical protein